MRRVWIILLLLLSPCALAAELRVGGFVVAPLVMASGPSLGGLLVDFINAEIQPQLPVQIKWMAPVSLERSVASLQSGELDVVLVMPGGPDGGGKYGLFNWVYLEAQPHLAVRADSALHHVSDLLQLKGMTLAWTGKNRPDLVSLFEGYGVRLEYCVSQNWQQLNLRKLAAGRVDGAFFLNPYSPQFVARQEGLQLRLFPLPLPPEPFRMAYSTKADREVLARFEEVAARAFSTPKFKAMLQEYMRR